MARPDTTFDNVDSQQAGWDATVDDNKDKMRQLLFLNPYPMPIFHRAAPDSASALLSDFAAADHKWCVGLLVDPVTAATNGYQIFSDGTDWRYTKSNTVVT